MRVFVTRRVDADAIERLRAHHDVEVWPGAMPPSTDELREHCRSVDGFLSLLTDIVDEPLLEHAPHLRVVSNYAVGFENVDTAAATRRGIPVGHTPGVLTDATAQLALTMTLDLLRRVSEADKAVHAGAWATWEPQGFLGRGLSETTLGLIGYGRIGKAFGVMAEALGMTVIYTDPSDACGSSLDEVLERADVVSLHAVLTPQSRGLINQASLARMRRGALLVNVARGAMVDANALVEALDSGHIAGAALDVTDPEPLPAEHPLLTHPNVIVTPHIASATVSTRAAMAALAVDNLLAGLAGRPLPHCANPEVYADSTDAPLEPGNG